MRSLRVLTRPRRSIIGPLLLVAVVWRASTAQALDMQPEPTALPSTSVPAAPWDEDTDIEEPDDANFSVDSLRFAKKMVHSSRRRLIRGSVMPGIGLGVGLIGTIFYSAAAQPERPEDPIGDTLGRVLYSTFGLGLQGTAMVFYSVGALGSLSGADLARDGIRALGGTPGSSSQGVLGMAFWGAGFVCGGASMLFLLDPDKATRGYLLPLQLSSLALMTVGVILIQKDLIETRTELKRLVQQRVASGQAEAPSRRSHFRATIAVTPLPQGMGLALAGVW